MEGAGRSAGGRVAVVGDQDRRMGVGIDVGAGQGDSDEMGVRRAATVSENPVGTSDG